ncbi:MAG: cell division protein FtsZ [Acidocella sp. 20-57-95]|nr:MAG: cell division protein FtsZ [Acidocella sp. 20-57-95]OYV60899.1 MAG: cell division protein FtsZ [Acidocella sp. 21-58-7]HQT63370.1 cell division protein FtsZ [Acidocella sp.]HQU03222.1 cell division protein FtsZ [Acidocella sp.]
MTLNLTIQKTAHTDFTPRITVIGVGGGGTNAVNNMIALNLPGVDFVVANTDAQSLQLSLAERRIQLGPHITQGNGAGGRPEVGKASADEASDDLARHLENTHMVFITAGMGGGTGTGAAPVIARMARERNILTIGVVTKPFGFEGKKRMRLADEGIAELQAYVDTLIVIPNQNLFKVANERTGWKEAFEMADNVLYMGVRGVTDLMVLPGLVNLDYADIRSVMAEMGKAMMGTGEASGEDRAMRAAEAAISNPLLEDTNIKGARGLLINITGGSDLTLFEMDQAATRIREEVDEDANIMVGMALDENLAGRMRISVVATGIDSAAPATSQMPKLQVVGGGVADSVAFPPHVQAGIQNGQQAAVAPQPVAQHAATSLATGGAGYVPHPPAKPLLSTAFRESAETEALDLRDYEVKPAKPAPQMQPQAQAQPQPQPATARYEPPRQPAPETAKRPSLFSRVFGGAHEEPVQTAPRATTHREPVIAPVAPRHEPDFHVQPEPARAAVRPAQIDEIGLEIPAFLRRSNS